MTLLLVDLIQITIDSILLHRFYGNSLQDTIAQGYNVICNIQINVSATFPFMDCIKNLDNYPASNLNKSK